MPFRATVPQTALYAIPAHPQVLGYNLIMCYYKATTLYLQVLVRLERLELSHVLPHQSLNLACLPIPPQADVNNGYFP